MYDFEQLKFYKCTSERHDGDENSEHKDLPKSLGIVHIGGPCLGGPCIVETGTRLAKLEKEMTSTPAVKLQSITSLL